MQLQGPGEITSKMPVFCILDTLAKIFKFILLDQEAPSVCATQLSMCASAG